MRNELVWLAKKILRFPKSYFWFFLDVTLGKCVRKNPCLIVLKLISSIVNLLSIVTTGKRVFNFRERLNITIVCKKGTKYSRKSKFLSLFEFPNPWDVTNQKRQLSINEKWISLVSEKKTPLPKELFLVFSWCDTRKMCKEKSMFDSSEIDLFDL